MENLDTRRKEVRREFIQYKSIIEEIKAINDRVSDSKKKLRQAVEELGEMDGRGHVTLEFEDVKITNQKRVSKSLDMEIAESLLESKGLTASCVKMVPVLDEDAIMAAHYKGELTEAEIDSMFPAKVSYALIL